jgi:hypothetical protein
MNFFVVSPVKVVFLVKLIEQFVEEVVVVGFYLYSRKT